MEIEDEIIIPEGPMDDNGQPDINIEDDFVITDPTQ